MSGKTGVDSPSKEEISRLVKDYGKKRSPKKKSTDLNVQVSTVVEKCHPILNGYRENITFCDSLGRPFAKKIVVNCMRCSQINDVLMVKN